MQSNLDELWTLMAVATLALAGCGTSGNQAQSPPAPAAEGIKRRLVEDLPAVGAYLPALDDGRVEIAGPEGWIQLPNTGKELVMFAPDKAKAYPRVRVTATDSPLPVLGDLTEENAAQFVTVFDESYRKKRKSLPEAAKPIILGGTPYIRQVRLVSISKKQFVLQWLATVQKGRMYVVELFCEVDPANPDDYVTPLTEARDHAYAVAAHLAPISPASEPAAPPAAEPTPAETPAREADVKSAESKDKE